MKKLIIGILIFIMLSAFAFAVSPSFIINPGANAGEMYLVGNQIIINYTASSGSETNYSIAFSQDAGTNWNNLINNISSNIHIEYFYDLDNLCSNAVYFTPKYNAYLTRLCGETMSGDFGAVPDGWTLAVYLTSNNSMIYEGDTDGLITASTPNRLNFCVDLSNPLYVEKNISYYIMEYKTPSGVGGHAFGGSYRAYPPYNWENTPYDWIDTTRGYLPYNACMLEVSFIPASYSWNTTGLNQSFNYLAAVDAYDPSNAGIWEQSNNTFYIGCIPSWQCGKYTACGNYRQECIAPKDIYNCGLDFTGNLSIWDQNCSINANTASIDFNNFDLRYSGNQFIFMILVLVWIICLALTFILQNHIFYILAFVFGIFIGLFLFQISWIAGIAILLIQTYIGIRYLPQLLY